MNSRFSTWLCLAVLSLTGAGCGGLHHNHNLPPADRLLGPGPGVGGPGPGVIPPMPPSFDPNMGMPAPTVQVMFARPDGMQVRWDVGGVGQYDSEPLVSPGRHNFPQGGIYRLKLSNIAGKEGVELYPTVEVGYATSRSEAFLAHNAIPVQFTEEDFDQVLSGNFVTKVIYLPDPEFQELALAGVETLVSTRLDPGLDPIVEADRRGAILGIVRLGNKDMEMPGMGGMEGGFMPGGMNCAPGGPFAGMGGAYGAGQTTLGIPPNVSGVSLPHYGMPITGTPIGLPGPPHIAHGAPAGLQKHVIVNHTRQHLPPPTEKFRIDVKQQPGFSYPKPVDHMRIREQMIHPHPGLPQMAPGGPGQGPGPVIGAGYGGDPNCVDENAQ